MDKDSYTKFFHIPKPVMHQDHKLFGPLYEYAVANGVEFLFETRALSFIVDETGRPMGVRVRDEVSRKTMDIQFKKCLLATGDWVSNQEMIATHLPEWTTAPPATYTSMGEGIKMATALGADLSNMDDKANLMSHSAPTVVWGFFDSVIHVYPDGKRVCNENRIFDAPGHVHENGHTFWWSIFDSSVKNGYHHTSFEARFQQGGVETANTIEELAWKTDLPPERLKATMERYNREARAGEDTEFGKRFHFDPLEPPYFAAKSVVVRYKTNGGLKIDEKCQVIDKTDKPIPNLYAAGSCQGETTPNVHDVSAMGMHAGQMISTALKG
jgi:succinate dehydrogenase/fumarate reductase flavoprotein subunit